MTVAVCPMNQSAIYKIEKGSPRRRITVDELLGFAKVFETSISALVLDPSIVDEAQAAQLFKAWKEAHADFLEAGRRAEDARHAFTERVGLPPDTVDSVIQAASGSTVWPVKHG
jgi:hypothetical protein